MVSRIPEIAVEAVKRNDASCGSIIHLSKKQKQKQTQEHFQRVFKILLITFIIVFLLESGAFVIPNESEKLI